ncbi:uncharacterized protein LOC110900350 [Helianthus annuus]|uniref:uncharacterized protein LOC110900350 n=1 Tax=Helianthus annuus TaxID=4232 RepID=UPI0016532A19|nr:uncharacterized protein LOC110900350 [Helianthus annuus]
MEKTLKVYIYKEGDKPIFHRPEAMLTGVYASEGWFMKNIKESKNFVTATDGADEIAIKREERENLALNHITKCQRASSSNLHYPTERWDTKFKVGAKTGLLQPFHRLWLLLRRVNVSGYGIYNVQVVGSKRMQYLITTRNMHLAGNFETQSWLLMLKPRPNLANMGYDDHV